MPGYKHTFGKSHVLPLRSNTYLSFTYHIDFSKWISFRHLIQHPEHNRQNCEAKVEQIIQAMISEWWNYVFGTFFITSRKSWHFHCRGEIIKFIKILKYLFSFHFDPCFKKHFCLTVNFILEFPSNCVLLIMLLFALIITFSKWTFPNGLWNFFLSRHYWKMQQHFQSQLWHVQIIFRNTFVCWSHFDWARRS